MLPAALIINPVSRWQRGFLLLIHGLALLNTCWWMTWPWIFGLSAFVSASCVWQWRRRPAALQVQVLADGQFCVITPQQQKLQMQLLASSVLTAHVLVLHLSGEGRRINFVLWPDSADAEVLRQWRVYLRWVWPHVLRQQAGKIPV